MASNNTFAALATEEDTKEKFKQKLSDKDEVEPIPSTSDKKKKKKKKNKKKKTPPTGTGLLREGYLGNLTPEQEEALKEMKKNFPDVTDSNLLRFLRARDFNVAKAIDMLQKATLWRKEFGADDIKLENVRLIVEKGLSYTYGMDKLGRPVVVTNLKYHDPKQSTLLLQYHIYFIENLTKKMGDSLDSFTAIFNLEGFTTKNVDLTHIYNLANVFQNYYPERLGIGFIINAPWFFGALWKIIKPWLDKRTASKIYFLDVDYKERLRELIDEQVLLPELGGKSTFDFRKQLAQDLNLPIEQIKTVEEANKVDSSSLWSRTKNFIWGSKSDNEEIPDASTLKLDENENKDKIFVDEDEGGEDEDEEETTNNK